MATQRHDLAVVGAGPGGYVAAIRAAQLGMRVVCVDDRPKPGGTCLHVGCIPSKALLDSTARLLALRDLAAHGIEAGEPSVDLGAMMERKDEAVSGLTEGVGALLDKHDVEWVQGRARLAGGGELRVEREDGEARTLRAEHVILATGSVPVSLPDVEVDEDRVLTSTGALALPEVPDSLVVIGGGYVGLELGSVWSRLGAPTTCVEATDGLLPGMDAELGEALQDVLAEQGLDFRLGRAVRSARRDGDEVVVELAGSDDDDEGETLRCSHLLVAVGRRPATDDLGLEEVGIEPDADGFVPTGEGFRTAAEGVYAIGDLAGPPLLAHKAEDEALACVESIAGAGPGWVHYDAVPAVVYTWPEVASVGRTEAKLREDDVEYRVGRFPFRHNPRARCAGESDGFVKLLADARTDALLGAHVLGPHAGTVIHELVAAVELGGSVEELARMSHGHPTWNEAVREAALALHDRAIHV